MSDWLPFVVIGLASGSAYALAAMGLVVTYTTSGIFNFAHGAVGMIATFIYYSLTHDAGWPAWAAIPVILLLVAPVMGVVVDRLLFARLAGAQAASYVVASLGLLVALQGLAVALYGGNTRQIDSFLPTSTFRLGGVNVGWDQAIIVVIAAVALVGLFTFFRLTLVGVQTRAVVDDADLTELFGSDARRITTLAWMLGCSFASLSGILLAPLVGLDAAILTLLVVQAFGAVAVGRLTSLPLAYLGALGIGVGAGLSAKFVADVPQLAGLPTSLPFIVLFAVLVLSPKGSFAEVTKIRRLQRIGHHAVSERPPFAALAVVLVVLAILPQFLSSARLLTASLTLVFVLVFASLSIVVGLSRQVSLCHAVFVGLGATTLYHLNDLGLPFLLALPLAAVVVIPVGALVAIPAIRLSGLFLALATFGFGLLVQSLVFPTSIGFGGSGVITIPRPTLFGLGLEGDVAYYWVTLVVVALGVAVIETVRRTRLGRFLRALADSPTAVESIGVRPTVARVLVFCLSAFLAAIAGGLLGGLFRSVNPVNFDFFQSLVWLTVLVTAGVATAGGSVVAALLFVTLPAVLAFDFLREWEPVLFGVAAMMNAQTPNGIVGQFKAPDFAALARSSSWRLASSPFAERRREAAAAAQLRSAS